MSVVEMFIVMVVAVAVLLWLWDRAMRIVREYNQEHWCWNCKHNDFPCLRDCDHNGSGWEREDD